MVAYEQMGSAPENEPSLIQKLSLFSLPIDAAESTGMLTPPRKPSASVPFQWEEAPGKPRHCANHKSKPENAEKCLELPPRLLSESKSTSPTTVLDGPYLGRSLAYTLSFRKGASFRSPEVWSEEIRERFAFGSGRWGSLRSSKDAVESNFDYSSFLGFGGDDAAAKVKIRKVRRRGSLLSLANTKSHLWASIYDSFKQVVPWKRRQGKLRKMSP